MIKPYRIFRMSDGDRFEHKWIIERYRAYGKYPKQALDKYTETEFGELLELERCSRRDPAVEFHVKRLDGDRRSSVFYKRI